MNQAASQESQIEATGSKVYSVFSHPSNAFFHGSELFSHASNLYRKHPQTLVPKTMFGYLSHG